MPLNDTFWNPYRLLNTKKEDIKRLEPIFHNSFNHKNLFSGKITCSLKNLTPFFIGGGTQNAANTDKSFIRKKNNSIFIPSTSLKGMFRSLIEYIGNGCYIVTGKHDITKEVLNDDKCSDLNKLCIACRMFGFMGSRQGNNFKGNVSFSDGEILDRATEMPPKIITLSNPKTRHSAFYTGKKLRKFYFHSPEDKLKDSTSANNQKMQTKIKPLKEGHNFKFTVFFENLREEELQTLLYAINLEQNIEEILAPNTKNETKVKGDMCHKLGMGKSIGLGTVKINIDQIELFETASRYSSYENTNKIINGDELKSYISDRTKNFINDKSEYMINLRKMMIFDQDSEMNIRYPSNEWFKENSQVKLKTI
jgi:CRISPR/Cas system CSM-associated protein Csm3 (group 7 of RAMP superfamily)